MVVLHNKSPNEWLLKLKLKEYKVQVKSTVKDLEIELVKETHLVRFGFLNLYKETPRFTKSWLGEYSEKNKEFMLFTTIKNTDKTSDFFIRGNFEDLPDGTMVSYSFHLNYTFFLGFLGLNLALFTLGKILLSKGLVPAFWYIIPFNTIASYLFYISMKKDYKRSSQLFKQLINKEAAS